MTQTQMYPAQINSAMTELSSFVNNAVVIIPVVDASLLPAAPNLATLGNGANAETILYTGKSANNLTGVTRGFQGTAQSWAAGIKVARYFTAYDHDTFRTNINDHETRLTASNILTSPLLHGLNYLSVDQAGAMLPTIYGRTLVNRLGNVGNAESLTGWATNASTITLDTTNFKYGTSAFKVVSTGSAFATIVNINIASLIDITKYYLILCDVMVGEATSAGKVYIDGNGGMTGKSGNLVTNTSGFSASYRKLQPSDFAATTVINLHGYLAPAASASGKFAYFDGFRIFEIDAATYALIDVDANYTGDKLAERFPYVDGIKHVQNPMITKQGKNLLPPFTDSWSYNAVVSILQPYQIQYVSSAPITLAGFTFPVISGQSYFYSITGSGGAYSYYLNFYDKNNVYISTSSAFPATAPNNAVTGKALIQPEAVGTYIFTYPIVIIGSTWDGVWEPRNDDYIYGVTDSLGLPLKLASSVDNTVRDELIYRDGSYRKLKRWVTDVPLDGTLSWVLSIDRVGYKEITTNYFSANLSLGANLFCAKFDNTPLSVRTTASTAGDQIQTYAGGYIIISVADTISGWGETYMPTSAEVNAFMNSWKMNNGTFGTSYNGTGTKTWTTLEATSNTGAVTVVPTTQATLATYTQYKLSYQLATSIEEIVNVEGSIGLHNGGNQIEGGEGVVVREIATPVTNGVNYYINNTSVGIGTYLKNRTNKILTVYKNGVEDKKWNILTSHAAGNGGSQCFILNAYFDATAQYTVTYVALDKYLLSANLVDVSIQYAANIGTAVSGLVRDMEDNQTKDTQQDWVLVQDDAYIKNLRIDVDKKAKVAASVREVLVTSTNLQSIATFTPLIAQAFMVPIYIRVITGSTTITITVTFTSPGGAQTRNVVVAQLTAIGEYDFIVPFVNSVAGSAISINITASVANQVYVTASIVGV